MPQLLTVLQFLYTEALKKCELLITQAVRPGFKIRCSVFFFPRSVTNRRLVSKAHAPPVHACSTRDLQKLSSWKVSTDSMICRAMKSHTNEHTVRVRPTVNDVTHRSGRPTLKDIKCLRNGSVCKPYEKSVYERTFWVNLSRIMLYQRSYQSGLSTLQLDKKHLQKRHRIFRRDREPSIIPARTQERLSNKSRKVREFVYECICSSHRRTGTFGLGGGGGGTLLPEKITQCPNVWVLKSGCKRTPIAWKT